MFCQLTFNVKLQSEAFFLVLKLQENCHILKSQLQQFQHLKLNAWSTGNKFTKIPDNFSAKMKVGSFTFRPSPLPGGRQLHSEILSVGGGPTADLHKVPTPSDKR